MNVTKAVWVCGECLQAFDMLDENDAQEWFYGHDCEAPVEATPWSASCPTKV